MNAIAKLSVFILTFSQNTTLSIHDCKLVTYFQLLSVLLYKTHEKRNRVLKMEIFFAYW